MKLKSTDNESSFLSKIIISLLDRYTHGVVYLSDVEMESQEEYYDGKEIMLEIMKHSGTYRIRIVSDDEIIKKAKRKDKSGKPVVSVVESYYKARH